MNQPHSPAKQRLLDAALSHFARHGFVGASIRNITNDLGLRESAFYAHFKSKQAAYDELFDEGGPAVVARFAKDIQDEVAPEVALKALASHVMTSWGIPRARALASVVLREAFNENGDKREALLTGIEEALSVLANKFKKWQRAGKMRKNLEPRTLAYQFVAPLVMIRFLYFNLVATDEHLRRGMRLVAEHVKNFTRMLTA